MELVDINPWWKTGKIGKDYRLLSKRILFKEIAKYIKSRQIIVITGLRRTGKTVLMHQLVDHLLKNKIKAKNIVYFNFDISSGDISEILEDYRNITEVNYKKEMTFVFLDEIQKLNDWQNKIKTIYDNYKNIKFFVSGSSSLFIEKRTKESLAGRSYSFQLLPLKFSEYLQLKKLNEILKNPMLFKNEIKEELKQYIISGGFPELINEKDNFKIQKYVKELIIDKIVYIDIPKVFQIDEPELLQRLISIISSSPGIMVEYESLASDLKRNRKTISNYLFYLEKAFLIKKIYNFSKNLLTSEKKKKKFYPSTSALTFLYNADYGKIEETIVLQNSDFKFFYRRNGKEIDFISINGLPIEVKMRRMITKEMKISMLDFMKRFKINKGLFITKEYNGIEEISWFGVRKKIQFFPLWRWLLNTKKYLN